jgi:hypothetical protein
MSGHARLFAASAAAMLASIAGAATVATFNYTAVESNPFGVGFSETVAATDPISNVRVSGSLTEINVATWGVEAVLEITAPDAQIIFVAPFNVLGFVGTITATDVSESFPIEVASAAGTWNFVFFEDFDDDDDGLADAVWDFAEINLESPEPPPACPPGSGTLTFTGVSSDAAVGGAGNSIVGGDFGVVGTVNVIRAAGQFSAFAPSWRSEAYVQATAPSGTIYNLLLSDGLPDSSGVGTVTDFQAPLASEAGTGFWLFEFYEGFVDAVSPDATWSSICFSVELLANTAPTGTGLATPFIVAADGIESTVLTVSVTPGDNPVSTGLAVTVDGSAIGAGTLTLLDDGVAPDAVLGDNIFTVETTVALGSVVGETALPFSISDLEGRIGTGDIDIFIAPPAPGCPAGAATLTVAGAQSDSDFGLGGVNTIVTHDFGVAGDINFIHFTGRATAIAPSWMSDAAVAMTTPLGDTYFLNMGGPIFDGTFDFDIEYQLVDAEPGTGTWTLEFYEDFDDIGVSPETTYQAFCVSIEGVQTSPIAVDDLVTPFDVVRDGVQTALVEVLVVPGALPTSTGITVVVDDSSIGGSGALALTDDGLGADLVADDGIYSGLITVAPSTPLGAAVLPYLVSDAEARTAADSLDLNVVEAIGACCTGSGCVVTGIVDCTDVQGGTFSGTGTACSAPVAFATDGAGAFEDISFSGTIAGLTGADDAVVAVALPFTFNFFGIDYTDGFISSNGNLQFGANNSASLANGPIPSAGVPNNALYGMWDDLDLDFTGEIYYQLLGTIGTDARFVIQWNNLGQYNGGATPLDASTFQIVLFEDGSFEFRYLSVSPESVVGDTTTFGAENADGTVALVLNETRDSLSFSAPISYRGNSTLVDTGICDGGNGCPPCAADYDNNGGVDGGDLGAFFADFEAGETCADVDGNGGVDGGDLGFFFAVFEAGGC